MKKYVLGSIFYIGFTIVTFAQFPYYNYGASSNGTTIFAGSTAGVVTYSSDGIRLTSGQSQFTGIYFEDLQFSTEKGFHITFEYDMFGGVPYDGMYGDGFALVLFDASVATPTIGAKGASLGYIYAGGGGIGGAKLYGLSKGFLGIGFDQFGSYKKRSTNSNEWKNGIDNIPGSSISHITIRGPYNPSDANYGMGYPVLASQATYDVTGNTTYTLNFSNGTYATKTSPLSSPFYLRGGGDGVIKDPNNTAYRKVFIDMLPGKNDVGNMGFYMKIYVQHGLTKNVMVLDDYFLMPGQPIKYIEAANATAIAQVSFDFNVPAYLRMGFTAGTGSASQYQYIRSISLSLPYSPSVEDKIIDNICKTGLSQFNPLINDMGYNSNIYVPNNPPIPDASHIDTHSFRFMVYDESTGKFIPASTHYVLQTTAGKYKYDPETGLITFTANSSLETSTIENETIHYDIKNKKPAIGVDISTEEYRSPIVNARIDFTTDACKELKHYIIINR